MKISGLTIKYRSLKKLLSDHPGKTFKDIPLRYRYLSAEYCGSGITHHGNPLGQDYWTLYLSVLGRTLSVGNG